MSDHADNEHVTTAAFVRSVTRLHQVPFVPEIRLQLADDIYALWEQTERELGRTELPPPFWAFAWPGGSALARFLIDHPAAVTGRSVLDIGSGSGLVAIAAAKAGASTVLATEPDPLARAAIALNAAANDVPAPACVDAGGEDALAAEVVVAGDVWYEQGMAEALTTYLDQAAARGASILTGDIGRRYFPRRRFECLASYELPASVDLEGSAVLRASVWRPHPLTTSAAIGTSV
jgi:predicted nicotinamide N-methyase